MDPYIVVFLTTIFFVVVADKFERNKKIFVPLLIVAVLIPSIMAGIRDLNIGIDIDFYAAPEFNLAESSKDFITYFIRTDVDKGYAVLVYISHLVFSDVHGLLFFTELIIFGCYVISIVKMRDTVSLPVGVFIYLFTMYNNSLNIMRQNIAISICILSLAFLLERKKKIALFFFVIAYTFHSTAILFLFFLYLADKMFELDKKAYRKLTILSLIIIVVGTLSYQILLSLFIKVGVLNSDYTRYFSEETDGVDFKANISYVVEIIMFFIASAFIKGRQPAFWKFIAITFFVFINLRFVSRLAARISIYPQALMPLGYAYFAKQLSGKHFLIKDSILLCKYLIMIALWYAQIMLVNVGETWPYESLIWEIFSK